MKRVLRTDFLKSFFGASIVILLGCAKSDSTPPEIRADKTGCTRCRMLISDTRFAAALKTEKYLLFDDIGCMLDYSRTHTISREASVWVRDFGTDTWIRGEEATFFLRDDKKTPMGYGYIALKNETASGGAAQASRIGSLKDLQHTFGER